MTVKKTLIIFTYIVIQFINARINNVMEPFIVGGFFSEIESFPFAAYVSKNCSLKRNSSCGAAILNQVILLTAAHCFKQCDPFTANAYAGSVHKYQGFENKVIDFIVHENYNLTNFANDIALLRLETELSFSRNVKRIILMKYPPEYTVATVAGWGWIDSKGTRGDVLKHTRQLVLDKETCVHRLGRIPEGTMCGSDINGDGYPEKGDSGSPLVINSNIQIGIVSFKKRRYTNDTIVYTNVSYFYDWVATNSRILYCAHVNETKKMLTFNTKLPYEPCALGKGVL